MPPLKQIKKTAKGQSLDDTVAFYLDLDKDGKLPCFVTFLNIKYRGVLFTQDSKGGFVHKSELSGLAKAYGISYSTIRTHISLCIKQGWIKKSKNGYKLISIHSIIPIKKLAFRASSKKELLLKITEIGITRELVKRIAAGNVADGSTRTLWKPLLQSKDYSLTVRETAKLFNRKSAMTGTRIQGRLKLSGKIKIEKDSRELCPIEGNLATLNSPEYRGRCFTFNGTIRERLRNNLIPVIRERKADPLKALLKGCKKALRRDVESKGGMAYV